MAFRRGHALVIGVGSYTYVPSANIPISVKDAQAVKDVLQNPELCGYPPDQVTVLHDSKASRENILTELDAFAVKTTPESTALFYYSGHGDYGTDGNYYLTTFDTRVSQGRVVPGTGIQEAELIAKLRSIPARRLLLLFNSCHSGEISPDLGFAEEEIYFGDINPPRDAMDALLSTGEGRVIIAASRPDQKSWIGKGKLSIYTQALVDGLSGKGYVSNNNGYVSVFSLYESMYIAIQEAAKALGKIQEPELTILRGVGPFPISLYRGHTPFGNFTPDESLPTDTATREVSHTRSQRLFQQFISTVEAGGERAVAIGGNVSESTIITGDQRTISTGGGAYIEGQIHTGGGDFIGRDKIITGDITASVAAIGDGIQVIFQNIERSLSDVEIAEQSEEREQRVLAESVTAHLKRLAWQAEQAQKDLYQGNPYKALLEYDIQDAALFYGRSEEIQELLECLQRDQLTVLHAESGAGKTSLLKAGIIPRLLTDSHLPLYLRPHQTRVHLAIKRGLLTQLETTQNLANASLHDFLRKVTDLLGGHRLVIIIDQFEEIFTMQDEVARTEFIDELAPCLEDDFLPVCWILSVRGEWLSQIGTFRPRIRNPFANQYLLRILTRKQAKGVILEPAHQQGVGYDSALVDRLLSDLGEQEINPPQLQLVCSALFDALNGGKQITQEMYYKAGEANGILKGHLERFLTQEIPRGQRAYARRLLEALVTSDNHRALRSRTSLIKEMNAEGINEPTLDNILIQFIDSRLVRVVELVESEELAYELAHDYLLSEVALNPTLQARKAAQELLAQKLSYYERDGLLLSADELAIINPQRKWLILSEEAKELLRKSRTAVIYHRALPWRDFLGGGIGFSLAYLITYTCQWNNLGLLLFSTFLRIFPAAIAGLALTLSIDLAITSDHGQRRRRRWLVGGLVGAAAFAMTLFVHKLLDVDITLLNLSKASIEGAFWGLAAGLGMVWVITSRRPTWQSLPVVVIGCGLVLMATESFGQAFHGPQFPGRCPADPLFYLLVVLAGIVMPLSIIGFALIWRGRGWRSV